MRLFYKGRSVEVPVRRVGTLGMAKGLMFSFKENADNLLLFDFNEDRRWKIHSFFVFFQFLAVWTDKNNKVLEFKIVKSFNPSVFPRKKFRKLVEIPVNLRNKRTIGFFVGKRKV